MIKKDIHHMYFWAHSSFSAISLAFFLSLLTASTQVIDDFSISIASVLFCISLFSNAMMAAFLVRLYALYPWWNIFSVPTLAMTSFLLGLFSLLSFFSLWLTALAVCVVAVQFLVLGIKQQNASKENWEKIKEKLQEEKDSNE
jgi:hypothetical protein